MGLVWIQRFNNLDNIIYTGTDTPDTGNKLKVHKAITERLTYAQYTSRVQMPKNTYSEHLRSYKSI